MEALAQQKAAGPRFTASRTADRRTDRAGCLLAKELSFGRTYAGGIFVLDKCIPMVEAQPTCPLETLVRRKALKELPYDELLLIMHDPLDTVKRPNCHVWLCSWMHFVDSANTRRNGSTTVLIRQGISDNAMHIYDSSIDNCQSPDLGVVAPAGFRVAESKAVMRGFRRLCKSSAQAGQQDIRQKGQQPYRQHQLNS